MKKTILAAGFSAMMLICGLTTVNAQEQPAPQKDTVNMDTDAKPTTAESLQQSIDYLKSLGYEFRTLK